MTTEINVASANKEWLTKSKQLAMMHNPFMSKEDRKTLNAEFVKGLSDNCFNVKWPEILSGIKFGKESCAKYADTETEVNAFIEWLPRFEVHKEYLIDLARKRRGDWGLPL